CRGDGGGRGARRGAGPAGLSRRRRGSARDAGRDSARRSDVSPDLRAWIERSANFAEAVGEGLRRLEALSGIAVDGLREPRVETGRHRADRRRNGDRMRAYLENEFAEGVAVERPMT